MAHTDTSRLDTYRKTLLDYYEEEIMGEADSAAPLRRYLEQCMVWCGEGEANARMSKGGRT